MTTTTNPLFDVPEIGDNGMAGMTSRVGDVIHWLTRVRDYWADAYEAAGIAAHVDAQANIDRYDARLRQLAHTMSIEHGTRHGAGVCWCLVERMNGEVVKVEARSEDGYGDLVGPAWAAAKAYGATAYLPDLSPLSGL